MLFGLLVDKGFLVAALAGGALHGARETAAAGVHALDLVALLVLGERCGLVAAVDAGGCGLAGRLLAVEKEDWWESSRLTPPASPWTMLWPASMALWLAPDPSRGMFDVGLVLGWSCWMCFLLEGWFHGQRKRCLLLFVCAGDFPRWDFEHLMRRHDDVSWSGASVEMQSPKVGATIVTFLPDSLHWHGHCLHILTCNAKSG